MIVSLLIDILLQFWWAFARSAPYLLLGLVAAGALRVLLPDAMMTRLLGGARKRNIALASLLGVPLPICSCGVVPVSVALRRKGAGRGATMSFLISTPETGVDSVALTFGLMGPLMAVFRPLVALVASFVGGILIEASDRNAGGPTDEKLPDDDSDVADDDSSTDDACCNGSSNGEASGSGEDTPAPGGKLRAILRYGLVDLLGELSTWLLLGLLLTALVAALLPEGMLQNGALATGLPSMLLMILVGLPVYMCASASTPLGAALVAKGLNPGAALVFLLVGPATNLATITLVRRFYGDRFIRVYLLVVVATAVIAGLALNALIAMTGWGVYGRIGSTAGSEFGLIEIASALLLGGLIIAGYRRTGLRPHLRELRDSSIALALLVWRFRRWQRPWRMTAAVVGVIVASTWLLSGLTVVRPGEVAVARRFGVPATAALEPGLHLRWPVPIEKVDICREDRVRVVEIGFRMRGDFEIRDPGIADELDLITGDENLVDFTAAAEYRVGDPIAFLYKLENPDAVVRDILVASTNAVAADRRIDDVLTTDRAELQLASMTLAQQWLARYDTGIELLAFRLLSVHAPPQVHDAFREVASAQEDALTSINRAHGDNARVLADARATAARMRHEAKADAAHVVARAHGDASAFSDLSDAARDAPGPTRRRLYLETLERVLGGRQKIVRPGTDRFDLWWIEAPPTDDDGGQRIRVPVIPQKTGDPTSMEVDLDRGYTGFEEERP